MSGKAIEVLEGWASCSTMEAAIEVVQALGVPVGKLEDVVDAGAEEVGEPSSGTRQPLSLSETGITSCGALD